MTWYRYTVFAENYKTVQDQNEKEEDLVFATNEFMDLTSEEFVATYTGLFKKDTHDYMTIDE